MAMNSTRRGRAICVALTFFVAADVQAETPNVFSDGTPIIAGEVNENFADADQRLDANAVSIGSVADEVALVGDDVESNAEEIARLSAFVGSGPPTVKVFTADDVQLGEVVGLNLLDNVVSLIVNVEATFGTVNLPLAIQSSNFLRGPRSAPGRTFRAYFESADCTGQAYVSVASPPTLDRDAIPGLNPRVAFTGVDTTGEIWIAPSTATPVETVARSEPVFDTFGGGGASCNPIADEARDGFPAESLGLLTDLFPAPYRVEIN